MSAVALIVGGYVTYKGYMKYNTHKETKARKQGDPELIYNTGSTPASETKTREIQKRRILVRLVYGAYDTFRCKSEEECREWWTTVHYDPIPLENVLTEKEMQFYHKELCKERMRRYFRVFRRKKEFPSPVAPAIVVAIRGTKITFKHDFLNDSKIMLELLNTSSMIRLLETVVWRLGEDNGFSNVCVTGHSLGAAAGLLVSRRLALKGFLVDSHLFNPPFATLELFVCGTARSLTNFLNAAFDYPRALEGLHEKGTKFRDYLHNAGSDEERRKALDNFKALGNSNWRPHLYVNEFDFICCGFVPHFEKNPNRKVEEDSRKWYSSVPHLLRGVLGDSETFHLIPKAVLCTIKKYSVRRVSAHMLWNWMDADISYEMKQSTLMGK